MKEVEVYKGYLIARDWFGKEGIRIFSPPGYNEMTGITTRTTVGVVDSVLEARKYIDELLV